MDFRFLLLLFDIAVWISFFYVVFNVCSVSFCVFGLDLTYYLMCFLGAFIGIVRYLLGEDKNLWE